MVFEALMKSLMLLLIQCLADETFAGILWRSNLSKGCLVVRYSIVLHSESQWVCICMNRQ